MLQHTAAPAPAPDTRHQTPDQRRTRLLAGQFGRQPLDQAVVRAARLRAVRRRLSGGAAAVAAAAGSAAAVVAAVAVVFVCALLRVRAWALAEGASPGLCRTHPPALSRPQRGVQAADGYFGDGSGDWVRRGKINNFGGTFRFCWCLFFFQLKGGKIDNFGGNVSFLLVLIVFSPTTKAGMGWGEAASLVRLTDPSPI